MSGRVPVTRHHVRAYGGGGPGIDAGVQLHIDQDFVLILLFNYSPPLPQQLPGEVEQLIGSPLP